MKRRIAFLTGILLVLGIFPAKAQGEQPPIPSTPSSGNYVSDELDWLTPEQENSINSVIHSLDRDGVAEIAVVTLDDCGSDTEAFRKSLFDGWGIGHADDNDGLLILVCWYGGDTARRSVEQLYGPGLNGILTSAKTDQVAEKNFVPAFHAGKPGDGLVAMIRSYNVMLRTPALSRNAFGSVVDFFANLPELIQLGLGLLVILGIQWVFGRFIPESWREYWQREGGNDRDSFGGGRSDGGGGSSTRF